MPITSENYNNNNNNLAVPAADQPKDANTMTQLVPFLFIPISIVILALIVRVIAPEWFSRVFCLNYCCKSVSSTESDSK